MHHVLLSRRGKKAELATASSVQLHTSSTAASGLLFTCSLVSAAEPVFCDVLPVDCERALLNFLHAPKVP